MEREFIVSVASRRQLTTPKRKSVSKESNIRLEENIVVTPRAKAGRKRKRVLDFETPSVKDKVRKVKKLRKGISELASNYFTDTNDFLSHFSRIVMPVDQKKNDIAISGNFGKGDIVKILKTCKGSKEDSLLADIVKENVSLVTKCTELDTLYLRENFSGVRLFAKLHQLIPGILPSYKKELTLKKKLLFEFDAVLGLERTSTGYRIKHLENLIMVLSFLYHWVPQKKFFKLYGDGREIGKQNFCL
jgi:hypothetical protein